jgi:hypothetical protein
MRWLAACQPRSAGIFIRKPPPACLPACLPACDHARKVRIRRRREATGMNDAGRDDPGSAGLTP